jgi:hypothetical protein
MSNYPIHEPLAVYRYCPIKRQTIWYSCEPRKPKTYKKKKKILEKALYHKLVEFPLEIISLITHLATDNLLLFKCSYQTEPILATGEILPPLGNFHLLFDCTIPEAVLSYCYNSYLNYAGCHVLFYSDNQTCREIKMRIDRENDCGFFDSISPYTILKDQEYYALMNYLEPQRKETNLSIA